MLIDQLDQLTNGGTAEGCRLVIKFSEGSCLVISPEGASAITQEARQSKLGVRQPGLLDAEKSK